MATAVYDLVELATGNVVGEVTASGVVRADDPAVAARVRAAFGRELLVRDGAIVEELGVCFADVETVRPGDPEHARLVLMNLAALAGVLPRARPR
ncbi:MAG: hypothetical protein ACRDJH_24020 [Thermomicrobiales bacterium]